MKTIDKIVPIKCNQCGKEIGKVHAQTIGLEGGLTELKSIWSTNYPYYACSLYMLCNECAEAIGDQI